MRFEVLFVDRTSRLVMAKILGGEDFCVNNRTLLGGARVESFGQPRKVGEDGEAQLDVFCFRLADAEAINGFRSGTVVELTEAQGKS